MMVSDFASFLVLFILPFIVSFRWFLAAKKREKDHVLLKAALCVLPCLIVYAYLWYGVYDYYYDKCKVITLGNLFLNIFTLAQHFLIYYSVLAFQKHKYAAPFFSFAHAGCLLSAFYSAIATRHERKTPLIPIYWVDWVPIVIYFLLLCSTLVCLLYVWGCNKSISKE